MAARLRKNADLAKIESMTDVDDPILDLNRTMRGYEAANNSRVLENIIGYIAPGASYWFSDGSHYGHAEIRVALQETFDVIQDEVYSIHDLVWITVSADTAVCRYQVSWSGLVRVSQVLEPAGVLMSLFGMKQVGL